MKSKIEISIIAFLVLFASACATIYKSPDLESKTSRHEKIAFLPFEAVIQYKKLPKNTTAEQMKEMENEMAYVFQEQMYTRFLRRSKDYVIEFQDVSMTNALLAKDEITPENIATFTKKELAEKLGVDAVVSGKILTTQPMSTGGAIASSILFGSSGATNKIDVNVSLHDGLDSKLLYKFDHTYSGGLGSSAESLSKEMMKQIARKFPYRR